MSKQATTHLDAEVAQKVMGWKCPHGYNYWMTVRGDNDFDLQHHKHKWGPTTDANHAREVEAEIERRDGTGQLQTEYVLELGKIVLPDDPPEHMMDLWEVWAMIRATPEQRCRAALKAVREGGGDD